MTPDHLHRRVQTVPVHRSAQNVVACDHRLQRQCKGVETLTVGKGEFHLHHIRVAVSCRNVVIQNALLQRRQRIQILDVGSTARYGLDQLIDGWLVEYYQRQHVGGDVGTAARNGVFREVLRATSGGQRITLFEALDQRRFVFTQAVQQAFIRQCAAIALHHQLTVLDRQVDVVGFQRRQKFVDAHRIISMFSVMAA